MVLTLLNCIEWGPQKLPVQLCGVHMVLQDILVDLLQLFVTESL
jgi:hypothetical protein